MKKETTFVLQQLIMISILVLVNVYYYQRLSSTFEDREFVKYQGAIEQMKSQIGLSLNIEQTETFDSFMNKTKQEYKDNNQKRVFHNPLNTMKEKFDEDITNDDITNVDTTNADTTNVGNKPKSIITCQEVIEQYPQKDKTFSITGTNLDDFQTMFKNVKKLNMVCKQQIPIGSIIPFAYYYEQEQENGEYKMLLNETDNTVNKVQILLRTSDNLVLVPLLGGTLTSGMISKILGDDCVFIQQVLSKSGGQMQLPNTDKKVLKQLTDYSNTNVDNSIQSGRDKIIQKIKKATLFFHDIQNNAKWQTTDGAMFYRSPPVNHTIKVKRGGVSKRNGTYNVNQQRNEESTITHYNSQQLKGEQEINIEDEYAQALFCMVIGYK